jgi:hypothetical protein
MNANRKNARWAGIFYILATAAPILTVLSIGFLGGVAGEPVPDYLVRVSENEGQVMIGVLTEILWALVVVGIVVTLLPILRTHHEALALGFSGLRFLEATSTMIHSIILLCLLTLSQKSAVAGIADASYFQTAGGLLLEAREWTFLVGSGLIWTLSALILNYLLYQKRLVPRWLSVWGLVGAVMSLAGYMPQFFGMDSIELLFIPIAVQEMAFAVWLIAKGLGSPTEAKAGEPPSQPG